MTKSTYIKCNYNKYFKKNKTSSSKLIRHLRPDISDDDFVPNDESSSSSDSSSSFANSADSDNEERDNDESDSEVQMTIEERLRHQFVEYSEFLTNPVDERSTFTAKTCFTRFISFMLWMVTTATFNSLDGMQLLHEFLLIRYQKLVEYSTYLFTALQYKPSTVVNYILDLNAAFDWFCLYRFDRHLVYVTNAGIKYI